MVRRIVQLRLALVEHDTQVHRAVTVLWGQGYEIIRYQQPFGVMFGVRSGSNRFIVIGS